ncbi:MAG: HAD family hydrolase [Sulfuricurvum sp.]
MITVDIPGMQTFGIEYLILDFNGTIAVDGRVYDGIAERLSRLSEAVSVHVITADTYGSVHAQCASLGVAVHVIAKESQDREKLAFIESFDPARCVAVGNGRNDILMLKRAALGFGILQEEGMNVHTLASCDILFPTIHDALDALLYTDRLVATLRN